MKEAQQRIREDLVDALDGEVRTDDVTLGIYATDGSLYEIRPLAVVYPSHEDDVRTVLQYATETGTPVIPRGAGTGVAGGCLGTGIVLDFSRHMRGIGPINGTTITVQPGVTRNELNRRIVEDGFYLAPDPANSETTTIGSMIAINAGGSHSTKFGSMRDHVRSASVLLPDGTLLETGRGYADGDATNGDPSSARLRDLRRTLGRLVQRHRDLINERQSSHIGESCGYFLRGLALGRDSGLTDLLTGSEGTLGVVLSAELHLTPLARARGAILALFGTLEDAVSALDGVRDEEPSACDLLDRRLLTLAGESVPDFAEMISSGAEAALVIDFFSHDQRDVARRLDRVERHLHSVCPSVKVGVRAEGNEDVARLWRLPQRVTSLLSKLPGAARPLPFIEDIAVPPERWGEFLPRIQKVLQRHEVTSSFYSHALAGKIHMRPFLPLPRTVADRDRIEAIARDVYGVVFACGGTMSAEHGDGFSRTAFVRSRYGPLYAAFRDVKRLFDPDGIMNPDTIVSDDQRLTIRNIRIPAQVVDIPLQLRWPGESFTAEINACNGCGDCRRTDSSTRMCPVFREMAIEEASPRAKANILRSLLDGTTPEGVTAADVIDSQAMRRLTETCFNCKQCRIDCPSHVDIPRLVIEARAADVAANGLTGSSWNLSRAHSFGALGCAVSPLANWVIGNPTTRWVLEKSIGVARRRKLPRFARRSFLKSLRKSTFQPTTGHAGATEADGDSKTLADSREVVYFVDHFANFHDVELAAATVAVLRHNGWTVHVPTGQGTSGMAMITAGDLEPARELAESNVRVLARYVSRGVPIVCSEPAAVLCLREEYPRLLDHLDVAQVAGAVTGVGELLAEQHHKNELVLDFEPLPLTVMAHTPCHVRALGRGQPLRELLALIPELNVVPIEKGCSGMAGAYGLLARHYEDSLQIGRELIDAMRLTDANAGTTSCSGCRMQMEQETSRPTIHPIKLIAASYGLLPNFKKTLQPNRGRLTIS